MESAAADGEGEGEGGQTWIMVGGADDQEHRGGGGGGGGDRSRRRHRDGRGQGGDAGMVERRDVEDGDRWVLLLPPPVVEPLAGPASDVPAARSGGGGAAAGEGGGGDCPKCCDERDCARTRHGSRRRLLEESQGERAEGEGPEVWTEDGEGGGGSQRVVKAYVYSIGTASNLQLYGRLFDAELPAIWHTSVVVFGHEFFYTSAGVCYCNPGRSSFGRPVEVLDMGTTSVDGDLLVSYLEGVKDRFTGSRYHIIDNNCNHFTDDLLHFLTGKHLPSHITILPTVITSTTMGQVVKPLIDATHSLGNAYNYLARSVFGAPAGPAVSSNSSTRGTRH